MHAKYPIWGNERTLPETCIISVTKTLKLMNSVLYGKPQH